HAVHHVDLDLDASTALRFHMGELLASVPWRAAQIVVIGVTPLTYSYWQTGLFMSILFHHSNARLPVKLDQILSRILVTPAMHGIHHSRIRSETDSNWSSGLSIWDRLHGTMRRDVPQREIIIGVPAYHDPAQVTLPKVLLMPLYDQKDVWQIPGHVASHGVTVSES
ncbi:MAG: sterol desaturase family protein, partial [Bryobacteraceae bacterium]